MITNTITYIDPFPTQWEYDNIIKPQMSAFDEYEPTAEEMIEMYNELQSHHYMTDKEINNMLDEMDESITDEELAQEFEQYQHRHPCEHNH